MRRVVVALGMVDAVTFFHMKELTDPMCLKKADVHWVEVRAYLLRVSLPTRSVPSSHNLTTILPLAERNEGSNREVEV